MSWPSNWLLTKVVVLLEVEISTANIMQRLHSSDEDLYSMPQEDLAEAFGTPPTRNNSIKPLRKMSSEHCHALPDTVMSIPILWIGSCCHPAAGKKTKKLEKEGTLAQKNKQVRALEHLLLAHAFC